MTVEHTPQLPDTSQHEPRLCRGDRPSLSLLCSLSFCICALSLCSHTSRLSCVFLEVCLSDRGTLYAPLAPCVFVTQIFLHTSGLLPHAPCLQHLQHRYLFPCLSMLLMHLLFRHTGLFSHFLLPVLPSQLSQPPSSPSPWPVFLMPALAASRKRMSVRG